MTGPARFQTPHTYEAVPGKDACRICGYGPFWDWHTSAPAVPSGGAACFCGQPGDRERVHRAHQCVPWLTACPAPAVPSRGSLAAEVASETGPVGAAGCPACAGAMPADQMGLPLQAAHREHVPTGYVYADGEADVECSCGATDPSECVPSGDTAETPDHEHTAGTAAQTALCPDGLCVVGWVPREGRRHFMCSRCGVQYVPAPGQSVRS